MEGRCAISAWSGILLQRNIVWISPGLDRRRWVLAVWCRHHVRQQIIQPSIKLRVDLYSVFCIQSWTTSSAGLPHNVTVSSVPNYETGPSSSSEPSEHRYYTQKSYFEEIRFMGNWTRDQMITYGLYRSTSKEIAVNVSLHELYNLWVTATWSQVQPLKTIFLRNGEGLVLRCSLASELQQDCSSYN